jgi:hypothetical protein
MPVKNRSHVVTLVAAIALTLGLIAVLAPAALAGRSEVYFSDVNGNPKTVFKIGEVLYVTIVSDSENRDSDEAELIDARALCQTHTGVDVPCVEIWVPNTKDSETNQGSLVFVETGNNTGIFRSQTGILVAPVQNPDGTLKQAFQENGILEVFAGDTITVRYQSPADDTDVSLDLAKVSSTAGVVRITNQAGREVPVWQVGQQLFVTVEDPDANLDPLKPDVIEGVSLWNPRCVWDVLERAGQPRSDQPEPTPCGAPVGFDDRLSKQFPDKFAPGLTLVETGPDTGVFRNTNGITLTDQLGPVREFRSVATALQLFVNHKDTLVAFYRQPMLTGQVAPPPPPPPPPVETRTDNCSPSPLLECSRTVPVSVAPGQTFNVTVTIKAKQDLKLVAIREQAPTGFRFGQVTATPQPKSLGTDGALRAAWDGNIRDEQVITLTYELTAGPTPGTFKIRGFVTSAPFTILPLVSQITVAPATGQGLFSQSVQAQAESPELRVVRQVPAQVNVGQPFNVTLTVTAKTALPAVSVKENFDGLTLVDQGADFIGLEGTTLRGLMIQPAAGTTQNFRYTLSCPAEGTYTITATVESRGIAPVTETSTIQCGPGAPPPPPAVVGFHRGLAGFADPQDFAIAQAKVAHANPAKIKFTDINGNELTEFAIGTEFFITVEDPDQNVDSDHVETICVQIFNVNGGREGDTPGIARAFQPQLKNQPGACLEDHVRDLYMWKTGVQLVETGTNTGVFRNPDALKVVPICDPAETKPFEEPFATAPADTDNIQIHRLNWWQKVKERTVLKECHPSTPFLNEARTEFPDPMNPQVGDDVPGFVAVHAGDVVYAVFQDQLVDPHDVIYTTARVEDFQTFDGTTLSIQFVDENGNPVQDGDYKVGMDVFIKLYDPNRNTSSDVVDKVVVLVLDRDSGDWENVILEETGPDTGEFMNRAGLSLQPATSPDVIQVNNNRLEVFDRDVIEAHYQDNFNPKDYSLAWVRLVPQPAGVVIGPPPAKVFFSDATGRQVTEFAVGDTVYVTVQDAGANTDPNTAEVLVDAITVTNTRTGDFVVVSATETGPDTGLFVSDPITTGAPDSGAQLIVEEGDTLQAQYNELTATVTIVTRVFACTGAINYPNPFSITTTFEAQGSGIAQITVTVYNLLGQTVAELTASGTSVTWDGRTAEGQTLASGVYLYQVTCQSRDGETATTDVQKLVFLK